MNIPDFSGLRVHVIGDAIRDIYTQAKCLGSASKSPTLVYEKTGKSEWWPGGAWVVASHCSAAGARVKTHTVGATVKERILVESQKVVEFHSYDAAMESVWSEGEWAMPPDVRIFADFGHGVLTPDRIPFWMGRPAVVTAADSQTTDISWGNILDFAGCDLLFANEREARFALRDQHTPISKVARMLWTKVAEAGTKALFVKLGAYGLWVFHQIDKPMDRAPFQFPGYADQPIVDPIGAGDALLAYATLTYAATRDLELAGKLGSLAAAEACAHEGNKPVTLEAVKRRANAL